MEAWSNQLFLTINASASPSPVTVIFAKIAAEGFVYLACLVAASLWVWGPPGKRGALLSTGLGLLASFAISWVIGLLWYHPRPFMIGLGHTLIVHAPDSSFPSEHTTFLWTLGLGLVLTQASRSWGAVLVVSGFVTAWARIYVGIHFPLDMAGSLSVAALSAGVAWAARPFIGRTALPTLDRCYETVLSVSRVPPRIFPRQSSERPIPGKELAPR